MKRYLYPMLWSCVSTLLILTLLVFTPKSRAQVTISTEGLPEELSEKASKDIREKVAHGHGGDLVRVIIQPATGSIEPSQDFDSTIAYAGGRNIKKFTNFPVRVVTMPLSAALELSSNTDVSYVSLDRDVQPMGHLSRTTGADQARTISTNNVDTTDGRINGTGIGIAIIDSGIDVDHKSFLNSSSNGRVVYSQDFTGEGITSDPYGHGTHVASLAAGNGRIASGQFVGIAPNANLVNLRVLNSQGIGSTSSVLRALDWIASNKTTYNIRVVNMSLGMPAIDSYKYDPICKAVRNLVAEGVVVLAAAGNNGKDSNGNKIYGHIHSPGIEPSAITVGAVNTYGT